MSTGKNSVSVKGCWKENLSISVLKFVSSLNFRRMFGSFHSLNHNPQLILKLHFKLGSTQLDGFYEQLFWRFCLQQVLFRNLHLSIFLLLHMVLILVHSTFWIFRPRKDWFSIKTSCPTLKTYLVYDCFCFDVLWS